MAESPLRWAGRALAIAVAVAFIALLAYGLASKGADTSIDDALKRGKPAAAPGFDLPVLQEGSLPPALAPSFRRAVAGDGRVSLRELRGLPVVLNFWASWCVPCRDEASELERMWRRARARGVLFVGLNMQDLTDDARAFLRDLHVTYPAIRDRGNGVSRDYGVTGVPETFYISRTGKVVGHTIGVADERALRAGIAAAVSGSPSGVQRGGAQGATRRAPPPARRPGE